MKFNKLNLLFSLAIIISSCSEKPYSLKENNLKGNVIKVYANTYEAVNNSGNWVVGEKQYGGENYVMNFNDAGYLKTFTSYDKYNDIVENTISSLDENNFTTKYITYDKYGKVSQTVIFHYGERNRCIKITVYNNQNKPIYSNNYDYSFFNKLTEVKIKDVNEKTVRIIKNNWDGNFIISTFFFDSTGKIEKKNLFTKNKFNDFTQIQITDAKDKVTNTIKYTYEYDEHDNWIKRTEYLNSEHPTSFTVRRIIYKSKNGNKLNSDELISIWKEVNDNDWIEFKKDGTYDKGYKENISDYGKWELNEDQKTLTLKSNDQGNSKKYSYEYIEQKLSLSSLDGNDRTEYEKR